MISSLLNGNIESFIVSLLLSLPIVMLALSLHETAHGFVAYKLGDPTAYNLGRLTLNPARHLDPLGFICMVLVGFGWAKPVPVNTRYFKKPKRDMALTALAGPVSNILLAFVFAVLLRLQISFLPQFVSSEFTYSIYMWLYQFLYLGVRLNVVLAVFNLIPVPPFDGSRIVLTLLPTNLYFKIMKYENYIYIVLMVALLLGFLDGPINYVSNFIMNIILNVTF